MDVAGARLLRQRLEELLHLHWHEAPAVRQGTQEAVDPDADHVVARSKGVRIYESPKGRFRKEIVDGRWERVDHSNEAGPRTTEVSTAVEGHAVNGADNAEHQQRPSVRAHRFLGKRNPTSAHSLSLGDG
jgi:hypothetical protein